MDIMTFDNCIEWTNKNPPSFYNKTNDISYFNVCLTT